MRTLTNSKVNANQEKILSKLEAGSLLRWVPAAMVGIKMEPQDVRVLVMDNTLLDDETMLDCMGLELGGWIESSEDPETLCCDYQLK